MDDLLTRLSEWWNEVRQPGALSGRTFALIVAGIVLVVGMIAWGTFRSNSASPERTPWICQNGHHFTLTSKELAEHYAKHAKEPVPCPKCGAPAERAIQCPNCGNMVVPHDDHLCPVCKKQIYAD